MITPIDRNGWIRMCERTPLKKMGTRHQGFTLVEILLALTITAILLAATFSVVDAGFTSYRDNQQLSQVSLAGRNIIHQLNTAFRTAYNNETYPIQISGDGTQCSFTDAYARQITYRYDSAAQQLLLRIGGADAEWHVVLRQVLPLSEADPIFSGVAADARDFDSATLASIQISLMLQGAGNAANFPIILKIVPRNVLYAKTR